MLCLLQIENFEEGRPLDRFFCHPLVWELKLHRYGQEHSPVRVPLPDGSRLLNRIYEIVTMAVISSDENGRTAWRQVGQELIGHVGELDDTSDGADLRVERWAALLDFDSYRLEDAGDGMIRVSPDLPEELEGGPEAELPESRPQDSVDLIGELRRTCETEKLSKRAPRMRSSTFGERRWK